MKVNKKVISNLTKCYSIAPLKYNGQEHILVAAEKHDPCYLFDLDGNREETIWTEPGGVMSMVQVPNSNGVFLATHKFYSPNDSKEAKVIIATPKGKDDWEIKTLVELPHVHRFDIVTRNNVNYLIACTLKSGHEYKDDWTNPGKIYVGVLPDDLSAFNEDNQLPLTVLKDNLLKNHGYYKFVEDDVQKCIVSTDNGVFICTPPEDATKQWSIEQILEEPASDAVLVDMDNDGEKELISISPFHGECINVYKKENGKFNKIYSYTTADFAHAIYGGEYMGKPSVIIGHRKGERNLLCFTYNDETKQYEVEILDKDCGPANVFKFNRNNEEVLISTNREINEVAMYTFEK